MMQCCFCWISCFDGAPPNDMAVSLDLLIWGCLIWFSVAFRWVCFLTVPPPKIWPYLCLFWFGGKRFVWLLFFVEFVFWLLRPQRYDHIFGSLNFGNVSEKRTLPCQHNHRLARTEKDANCKSEHRDQNESPSQTIGWFAQQPFQCKCVMCGSRMALNDNNIKAAAAVEVPTLSLLC